MPAPTCRKRSLPPVVLSKGALSAARTAAEAQEAAHVRYMALIFSEESKRSGSEEALERGRRRFVRSAQAAGVLVSGESLQMADTATVVQARDSGTVVTDGPFTGAEATLDGYYVLECDNLDQAIEWAARIPEAAAGAIEVRPVRDASPYPGGRGN